MLSTEYDPSSYNAWLMTPNVEAALEGGCSAVFNFTSLGKIHHGCGVFTKTPFSEWSKRMVKAPIFCTVGTEKVGKTWSTGRLMNKGLPADAVLSTPGICITTLSKARVRVRSPKRNVGTGYVPPSEANSVAEEDEYSLIALDTEGSLAPTHVLDYEEKKATETLLRLVSLMMSQRIVLVINKWDSNAQDQIRTLLKQQQALLTQKRKFARIIVIHNYKDVTDPDTLDLLIQKVENCYTVREGHKDDPRNEGWEVKDYMESIYWFKTKNLCHFFLVKEDPEIEWTIDNNKMVFSAIKNELQTTDSIELNIFDEFRKPMTQQLHWYLSGWGPNCSLELQQSPKDLPNVGLLVPGSFLPSSETEYKFEPTVTPFTMNKMKFGETGAVSETISEILFTWRPNKETQEVVIRAETRGFNDSHINKDYIRYKFDRVDNALHFDLVLPEQEFPSGFEEDTAAPIINSKQGIFSCYFPEQIFPDVDPRNPEELFENTRAIDGILYFKLKYRDFTGQ